MIDMRVKVKWIPRSLGNRPEWDKEAMKRAAPLINVVRMLAAEVRARVVSESRDANGKKFSTYADRRKKNYIFWVDRTKPQPAKGRIRGPLPRTGTVGYASSLRYHYELTGASAKNFWLTGEMWKSLRVRAMTPEHIIVAFYGSSEGWFKKGPKGRKTRNADKAFYAARRERLGLLWISDAEAEKVYKFIEESYDAKLSALIRETDNSFKITRTQGRIKRSIQRAERKLVKYKNLK